MVVVAPVEMQTMVTTLQERMKTNKEVCIHVVNSRVHKRCLFLISAHLVVLRTERRGMLRCCVKMLPCKMQRTQTKGV